MKYLASEYNVGYSLHGAKFLNDCMLLVTGGGGQANTDIPNKLTALRVDFEKKKVIKRFREITLNSNDDCPTTLDAAAVHGQGSLSNVILMGCNETNSTPNHHLRKFTFENDHLKFIASADFNRSDDPTEYNKLTALSSDGTVAAIASSKLPTVIRIIDPMKMGEKYEIETGNQVKDLHFSPDGKVICYITETTLEVISIVTGRFIIRKTDFNKQISLSNVRFLTNDVVAVAGVVNNKAKDITISTVNIKTKNTKVILSKSISSSYTGITAMDISKDGQLIALATNERSLLIVKSKDLSVTRSFKNIHQGNITEVVFSPNGQFIASVSSADTIHVVKLPPGLAQSTSFFHKLLKLLINILLTVGVIGVAYVAYYFDLHTKSYDYINEKYIAKRDTSQYFQMNDGIVETSTQIIDDIVSVHTLTRGINTESDFNTETLLNSIAPSVTSSDIEILETSFSIPEVTSVIEENEDIKTSEIYEESIASTLIDIPASSNSKVTLSNTQVTTTDVLSDVENNSSSVSSSIETSTAVTSTEVENVSEPSSTEMISSSSSIPTVTSSSESSSVLSSTASDEKFSEIEPISTEIKESTIIEANYSTGHSIITSRSSDIESIAETTVISESPSSESTIGETVEENTVKTTITEKSEAAKSTESIDNESTKAEKPVKTLEKRKKADVKRTSIAAKHTITVDGVVYEVVSVSSAPTDSEVTSFTTMLTVSASSNVPSALTTPGKPIESFLVSSASNIITMSESETILLSDSKATTEPVSSTIVSATLVSSISKITESLSTTSIDLDIESSSSNILDDSTSDYTSSKLSKIVPKNDTKSSVEESLAKTKHRHTPMTLVESGSETIVSTTTVDEKTALVTPAISSFVSISSTSQSLQRNESTSVVDTIDSPVSSKPEVTATLAEFVEFDEFETNDNNGTISSLLSNSEILGSKTSSLPTIQEVSESASQTTEQPPILSSNSPVEIPESKIVSKTSVAFISSSFKATSSIIDETLSPVTVTEKTAIVSESVKKETLETSSDETVSSTTSVHTSHIHKSTTIIEPEVPVLTIIQAPVTSVTETSIEHDEL